MAIPDSPNWSSLTDIKPYPQPAFDKPAMPSGVAAISLGPVSLNNSQGKLNSRYWLVTQVAGQVLIQGQELFSWASPVTLFNEPDVIQQISLTFDQLGRPLVFYRTGVNTLKLYWYDPVIQQNVNVQITTGIDPVACFDFPQATGESFTDALLFYTRNNRIYMRVQRDRFNIEYYTGVEEEGIRLESAGLRVDNRLQVVYTVPGDFR